MADGKIPIGIIKLEDYGNLDAVAVLRHAEELIENHKDKSI